MLPWLPAQCLIHGDTQWRSVIIEDVFLFLLFFPLEGKIQDNDIMFKMCQNQDKKKKISGCGRMGNSGWAVTCTTSYKPGLLLRALKAAFHHSMQFFSTPLNESHRLPTTKVSYWHVVTKAPRLTCILFYIKYQH